MGEEEATMRERLVEAIGDAIAKAWNSTDLEAAMLPPIDLIGSERDFLASSALDTALGMLETPSEEMIVAGGKAMHWDGWRHDVDDENFTPEEYEADPQLRWSFERTARPTWQSMLATLRSPKI